MKNRFKLISCLIAILAIYSCTTDEVGFECIECDNVRLLCEGDDDGNGGVITKEDLENAIINFENSGLQENCAMVDK